MLLDVMGKLTCQGEGELQRKATRISVSETGRAWAEVVLQCFLLVILTDIKKKKICQILKL